MAQSQMNVRIDDRLKASGDAVFASMGYSPSQVVRSVWSFAATHADRTDLVQQGLSLGRPENVDVDREYRDFLLRTATEQVDDFMAQRGWSGVTGDEHVDWKNLKEAAYEELWTEKGLLS